MIFIKYELFDQYDADDVWNIKIWADMKIFTNVLTTNIFATWTLFTVYCYLSSKYFYLEMCLIWNTETYWSLGWMLFLIVAEEKIKKNDTIRTLKAGDLTEEVPVKCEKTSIIGSCKIYHKKWWHSYNSFLQHWVCQNIIIYLFFIIFSCILWYYLSKQM